MKIKVLYEDANILAIDKPVGILVHPVAEQARNGAGPNKKETIYSIFKKKYPKIEVVHRLDRDTSGVMLLAKNAKTHEFLKKQFQARTIKKTYNAVVNGWLKNERGVISKPIGRSGSDFRKYSAARGARGEMREASTRYRVLEKFSAPSTQNFSRSSHSKKSGSHTDKNSEHSSRFSFLEVFPKTGRTHQIRVHMKSIGHAVMGDMLYNPHSATLKDFKRMALHAKQIEFTNLAGKKMTVESPLPKEFKKVIT